jgi:hypothetical protein
MKTTLETACIGLAAAVLIAIVLHAYNVGARTCAVCGEAILMGSYYEEPEFGDIYHIEHKDIARCTYCGRVLSPFSSAGAGIAKADGRRMCPDCHQGAVVEWDKAAKLAKGVRARMKTWGLDFGVHQVPIALVDEITLTRLGETLGADDGTLEGLTQGLDTDGKQQIEIFVLSGLPEVRCRWVIAHELMHAWLFQNHSPKHKPKLEEGAAELAGYRLLREHPSPAERRLIRMALANPDPVYGAGLRKAASYEHTFGFGAFLKMLAKHTDYPAPLSPRRAGNKKPPRLSNDRSLR